MNDANKQNWLTETVRVTLFPSPGSAINTPDTWWEQYTGLTPENITKHPKDGTTLTMGRLQDEDISLILSVKPDRIDWQLIPENTSVSGLSTIGPLDTVLDYLLNPTSRFLEQSGISIQRIAYGAIQLLPTESKIASYETLDNLLHNLKIDPEESSDLIYQINRPRKSNVDNDLDLNRLSKWSAIVGRGYLLSPSHDDEEAQVAQAISSIHACKLELDINTSATRTTPLHSENINKIVVELTELGKEIAENGDIR